LHKIFKTSTQMKIRKIAALVAGIALLSSCDYQKYNRAEQKDVQAGNQHVYGVHPDSSARQLANKYEDNPETDKRANAIREKFFGTQTAANGDSYATVDTTAKAN
jgi:uncharacterized membrane protein